MMCNLKIAIIKKDIQKKKISMNFSKGFKPSIIKVLLLNQEILSLTASDSNSLKNWPTTLLGLWSDLQMWLTEPEVTRARALSSLKQK